jgi:gliding motility-associated lipoprotein GldH
MINTQYPMLSKGVHTDNAQFKNAILILSLFYLISSCTTIDLFEKTVAIPNHKWSGDFKPEFSFTVKDTSARYKVFFIIRHTEKYNYNNIYINLYTKGPGADSVQKIQREIPLATDKDGWLGSGMNDIFEQRYQLTSDQLPFYFPRPGAYTLSVEQIMREQPLEHIMNVGLRIEKQ